MRELSRLLRLRHPIVQAPMAGGITTPELVAEVSGAGALGSIGAAYLAPPQIEALCAAVRARTSAPFAVNLFAPGAPEPSSPEVAAGVAPVLDAFRAELGLPRGEDPPAVDGLFEAQLEAVLRCRPAVFSFTFGLLAPKHLRALRAASIVVIGTATTVEEAALLEEAGVDAISAQGAEAGAHRGTFAGAFEDALVGTMALVPQVVARVRVPVLAAGGIMDGRGVAAALALGAAGAQLGTAFLGCPEAGISPAYRAALRSDAARRTVVTRAFTGRPGRAIRNRFTDAFEGRTPPPFPEHHRRTLDLRAAAARQGRTDLMLLWAGQGAPLVREMPARELVETLAREMRETRSGGAC
ncbi:NAD(P)H-dependent flavin oxidoreductase [Sorangium sp. So ce118]